ncbi:GntR family transcriptional regulator [Streptomyces olivaceus]|uniref:GntR family transcriptional regulator n=1 Tax=Streptomyces olivaceus TaxID=47716 RepID=A0ABS7WDA7_STROV|nr:MULTISPECIES: GntR family transcriptional regulator [Streptomyces]MBZ6085625.1 GntR family transcriptional regulator [Streptomyces olivaceus]MBZ6092731.1 GntR family transcriptional regulator [Streptomyces olivaceus]MBZ6099604.1 GntR family transcriptional regulator [Streptomyces olivaceus]MBZ6106892.1 GntR family transcriptional regulator [Streptomyces olivaceus]MBZ6120515.1 GntR family transcriptional regulator [Streptomyces olivaceus]
MRIPAHSVCTAIRDDIVTGVHARGSRLTEELLARRYGVSRVPVREALRTLEAEGFVVTRRHAGACVAEPSAQEAADLLETRALLEPLGAARAARRRTDAHLRVLRGLVRLGQERARQGAGEELRPLGGWFHETLAQAAGSPSLTALLTQLRHKIAWMYTVDAPAGPVEYWAEHGAIVDAVARGDGERARALMALHTERSTPAHRLRFAPGGGRTERVRNAQPRVNTASVRQ